MKIWSGGIIIKKTGSLTNDFGLRLTYFSSAVNHVSRVSISFLTESLANPLNEFGRIRYIFCLSLIMKPFKYGEG